MFMGHYAAAFAARRIAPAVPLPAWFVACQVIDLSWGALVLLRVEKLRVIPGYNATNGLDLYYMPYTHSLSSALIWSATAALLFRLFAPRDVRRLSIALLVGVVVASHWILDFTVHLPDLPLWFDREKVGLGWWNHRTFALLLELGLLWAGVLACLPAAENRKRYLQLAGLMCVVQVLSLYLEPDTDFKVAGRLLITYVLLTFAAAWATRPVMPVAARAA